jgi:hypothetical protein
MAKYFIAKLSNIQFRLRVELTDQVALFSFLYFENTYKILTYAFCEKDSNKAKIDNDLEKYQEVTREKAEPIIQLGMTQYLNMMNAVKTEPNF